MQSRGTLLEHCLCVLRPQSVGGGWTVWMGEIEVMEGRRGGTREKRGKGMMDRDKENEEEQGERMTGMWKTEKGRDG